MRSLGEINIVGWLRTNIGGDDSQQVGGVR